MKKAIMQIFRSIVTIVVVGVMAAMIFSLRGELRETKAKLAAAEAELAAIHAAQPQPQDPGL